MAAQALRVLGGASPASVAIEIDGNSPLAFDARQLARWGIDEALLPPGALVEHRPLPSFYQANLGVIWAAIGFIAVQSAIIGGLVLNVRRRRRAERTLGDQTQCADLCQSCARGDEPVAAASAGCASAGRGAAETGAEDGSGRPARRRHCPRLQQPADGHHRLQRAAPAARSTPAHGAI